MAPNRRAPGPFIAEFPPLVSLQVVCLCGLQSRHGHPRATRVPVKKSTSTTACIVPADLSHTSSAFCLEDGNSYLSFNFLLCLPLARFFLLSWPVGAEKFPMAYMVLTSASVQLVTHANYRKPPQTCNILPRCLASDAPIVTAELSLVYLAFHGPVTSLHMQLPHALLPSHLPHSGTRPLTISATSIRSDLH